MKKLYLDIGNSQYKMAVYSGGKWSAVAEGKIDQPQEFRSNVLRNDTGNQWIISSVRKDLLDMLKTYLPADKIQVIGNQDIPPDRIDYRTPHTLGMDRFLVTNGAYYESGKSVIVIDAGSAITIDLMSEKGVFLGGVIMPGLRVQRQSVADHLPELPAVENMIPEDWPGKSSKECLEWGIHGSLQYALKGFMDRYTSTNPESDLYLTGGDSEIIKQLLKSEQEIRVRKFLLFEGMRLFAESI